MAAVTALAENRAERRKRETRQRLLDAALEVFVKRGFDTATTAEIATAADCGAGTFYLHFKDKRDVYESLARHAAREMIEKWRTRLRPGLACGETVALGLETVAAFWSEDPARARLLLEGGPSFGSEAHLRLVQQVAELIREAAPPRHDGDPSPEVMATVMIGLGIELGRVIVAGGSVGENETVTATIDFARRTLCAPALVASRRR